MRRTRQYKLGSREKAIRALVSYAIRDQQSLLDAWRPEPWQVATTEQTKAIKDCQDAIEDFRHLAKTLK